MKNNQKTSGKRAPQQPLSKKQRKKLEKSGVEMKIRAPREKMPREKKWLISLIAAVCVMAIACASFGGILLSRVISNALDDPYASVFDELKLKKHINVDAVNRKFYTQNPLDFSDINEAYAPLTLADMDEYIESVCVNYRTLNKEMQRDRVIGLGDTVSLYVVDAFKGNPLTKAEEEESRLTIPSKMEELFGTYTSPITLTVGGELFGDDFDDKLIEAEVKPTDTVRETRENNKKLEDGSAVTFTKEDVVCITYYFQKSKGESATPLATDKAERYNWNSTCEADYVKFQARVDLKDLDETFVDALIEECDAIGETFTFVMENYNLTGGNKTSDAESDYKVTAQVLFVIEEEVTKDITFTVPEGYFGENDGDFYALNGKTATLRLHFRYADDYEPATFNRAFITETLKMEIAATDDDGAVAEYKAKQLEILNNERAANKILAQYDAAISYVASKAISGGYFLDTVSNEKEIASAVEAQITRNLLEQYLASQGHPPTSAELDEYAISIAKMQDLSVSGASEYISNKYSSDAEQMKKIEILVYTIFKAEKMKITDEQLDAAYAEYMAKVVGSMWNQETHNQEYFETLYGDEILKSWARRDLVYKMVGEYLLANNSYSTK